MRHFPEVGIVHNMKLFHSARISLLFLAAGLLFWKVSVRSQTLELMGHSDKAAQLDVSPNGKWLLSWDGVTQNTPATNPGDRLVWNLTTKKARNISKWSTTQQIQDNPCGWTPDNRIWQLRTNPQPLSQGNSPYKAEFFLENPDGSGKVLCTDPNNKVWFDDLSYFDDMASHEFSTDGKWLFVLSNSYYRIFDARNGKMVFRRRLRQSERARVDQSPDGPYIMTAGSLSFDGITILAVTGQKNSEETGRVLDSSIWKLRDARSGRILKTLKVPQNACSSKLIGKDLFSYERSGDRVLIYARLSDGKTLWTRGNDKFNSRGEPMTTLWVWNNQNGRDCVFAAPKEKKWRDLQISPDSKVLYGATFDGAIYRFAAHEMKP